jgi:hypothetical protein
LGPYFGTTKISKLAPSDIDAYIGAKRRAGLAIKTITNHLNFAHGVFAFALRRGWVVRNPVAMTDRPPSPAADPDIRFLDREELEALLRGGGGRPTRHYGSCALAHRRHDRAPAGRACRAALARRRLGPTRPRPPKLLARTVDDAEEPSLEPRGADG